MTIDPSSQPFVSSPHHESQIAKPPSAEGDHLRDESDLLSTCVHCGFCLPVCPTYQLSGDENNSPRGRLRLWRAEAEGRLERTSATAYYTEQCVGCLACEPVCPANVPYGEILELVRGQQVAAHRNRPNWKIRFASLFVRRPRLMQATAWPLRLLRRFGVAPGRLLFPGRPSLLLPTAEYARRWCESRQPTGPRVALFTGCLMESVFREINFATVRLLVEHNFQVVVPSDQTCCGAFQSHAGLPGSQQLQEVNRQALAADDFEAVVTNSAGCGHALAKIELGKPVYDVLVLLDQHGVRVRPPRNNGARVYVDMPCHLLYGQRQPGIPESVLNGMGIPWQWAPRAGDCCGSGGTYNLQRPTESQAILAAKAAFLNEAAGDPVILATANHVCMMQWYSARRLGLVKRPFQVRHIVQLLAPEER